VAVRERAYNSRWKEDCKKSSGSKIKRVIEVTLDKLSSNN
jgi:hypothetical protein